MTKPEFYADYQLLEISYQPHDAIHEYDLRVSMGRVGLGLGWTHTQPN